MNPAVLHRQDEKVAIVELGRIRLLPFRADRVVNRIADPLAGAALPDLEEVLAVVEKRVPYFKTGKELRERLNQELAKSASAPVRIGASEEKRGD